MTPAPPRPGLDHILIVGPGKTGTTGLFASIKGGLQAAGIEAHSVFEPPNTRKIDNLICLAPGTPLVVKTTMDTQPKAVPEPRMFDRIVMTVRDPRDMVLSSLLFRPLTVASIDRTNAGIVEKFIAALERKQADPGGTSVRELFDYAAELTIGAPPFASMVRDLQTQRTFLDQYPLHVMQYERFVLGELDELSAYLGFPVHNVAATSSMFGFITRSKGSGEFRQWFTRDDLAYFNEMFEGFLVRFGYPLDVELPEAPVIDPATGSEYVRAGYAKRNRDRGDMVQARSTAWLAKDVTDLPGLQHLIDFGTDGDAMACARVAEVILSGHLGPEAGTREDALRWARAGAQLGGLPAMQLAASLLRRSPDADAAAHREARRWKVETNRRTRLHSPEDKAKIAKLEKEVASLRRTVGAASGTGPIGPPRGDLRTRTHVVVRKIRSRVRRAVAGGSIR